ncbi:MAG: CoA pyrophosphatase [Pseudomonadota bacterium]
MVSDELKSQVETALSERSKAFAGKPRGRRIFDELNPEMAEQIRPYDPEKLKPAAVLLPIIDKRPEPTVLLTVRTNTMPSHPGQISLPGGRIQAEDGSPAAAALRETWEETGIHPDYVATLGQLEVHEGGFGFSVTPVIGVVSAGFELQADAREVADMFETPLSHVLDGANYSIVSRSMPKGEARFRAITHGERQIWGLTASILHSFQQALSD